MEREFPKTPNIWHPCLSKNYTEDKMIKDISKVLKTVSTVPKRFRKQVRKLKRLLNGFRICYVGKTKTRD